MTDRRSGPPLFDLMRDRGEHAHTPRPQPMRPTEQPASPQTQGEGQPAPATAPRADARQTAWDATGGVTRAERSAAAMLDDTEPRDSGITLSTAKFYSMIAVALALIVAAWAGGYRIGFGDGKDSMSAFILDEPVVTPPAAVNDPAGSGADTATPAATPVPIAGSEAAATPQQPGASDSRAGDQTGTMIMTPTGYRSTDPRTPGMNYLVLATLPAEQAADAIDFMRANGVTIIGVPLLDSRGGSANNPTRYKLYSLGLAIPGNRWSAMSNQRLEHQQMIANLGARWQRERRGGSDFSRTNWEKYNP